MGPDRSAFINNLTACINRKPRKNVNPLSEAESLFESGHYRASIVSLASALEALLRLHLARADYPADFRTGLTRLLTFSLKAGVIDKQEYEALARLSKQRNEAVHLFVGVERDEAALAITTVKELQIRLRNSLKEVVSPISNNITHT